MEEIEVKFLDIDVAEIERKLAAIGAEKIGDFFHRRRVFDYPDWRLDKKGAWLRVRDEGDRVTMGYKQRMGISANDGSVSDGGMKEVEIIVDDFEKAVEIVRSLGFIEKFYQENKRIKWIKDDIEFDIDTWPGLDPYLEIEASSWEKVDSAIAQLNLNIEDKEIFSNYQAYKMKGIDISDYQRMAFDGLVKREAK